MNKHSYIFSIVLLFAVILWSCGAGEVASTEGETKGQDYVTYVADSLTFDYLSEVEMMDYNEETKEMILMDRLTREILIIDSQGEIISKFDPHKVGPGYVGDFDHGWVFFGNDELVCYSNYYFYQLSKEGEFIAKHKYPVDVAAIWSLDYRPEMSITYQSSAGQPMLLAFITEPAGARYNTEAFQDSINMIYNMNLSDGISEAVMRKRPESVYRTLGRYVDRGWPYFTQVDNNKVAVTYSIDDKFYLFDAEKDELLQTFKIPAEHKPTYETLPFGETGEPDIFKINMKVVSDGKFIMLDILGLIPESIERVIRRQERWYETQAYKEARAKYSTLNTLIYNVDGRYLGEVTNRVGMLNYDFESTSDGFYWAQRRYNDERDYKTFLKIKVKPMTN